MKTPCKQVWLILFSTPSAFPNFFHIMSREYISGQTPLSSCDWVWNVPEKGSFICILLGFHPDMTFPTLSNLKARENFVLSQIQPQSGKSNTASYLIMGSWPILKIYLCSLGWKGFELASDIAHRRCSLNLPLHWHLSWSMVSKRADKIAGDGSSSCWKASYRR